METEVSRILRVDLCSQILKLLHLQKYSALV